MEENNEVHQRKRTNAIQISNVSEKTHNWALLILERFSYFDPIHSNDNPDVDPEKNYLSNFHIGKQTKFFRRAEEMEKAIKEEYEKFGSKKQLERDSKLWRLTLRYPQNVDKKNILKRIFLTLKFGGLIFQNEEKEWKNWSDLNLPISSVFGHGGRVLIQLPPLNDMKLKRDHSFWCWLITGDVNGDLSKFISTSHNSEEAEKEGKVIFKRLAATHSIKYNNIQDSCEKLIDGKVKYLFETKSIGISLRDSKIIQSKDYVLHHHRHWGLNLPIGGYGRQSFLGEKIQSNGEFGHMYIYYMSSAKHRCGGLLIGLESSEFNRYGQNGHKHTIKGDSHSISPTFGFKWSSKSKKDIIDDIQGPTKKNGMFIDLSNGWNYLLDYEKLWNDDWVSETSKNVNLERKENKIVLDNKDINDESDQDEDIKEEELKLNQQKIETNNFENIQNIEDVKLNQFNDEETEEQKNQIIKTEFIDPFMESGEINRTSFISNQLNEKNESNQEYLQNKDIDSHSEMKNLYLESFKEELNMLNENQKNLTRENEENKNQNQRIMINQEKISLELSYIQKEIELINRTFETIKQDIKELKIVSGKQESHTPNNNRYDYYTPLILCFLFLLFFKLL